MKPHSDHKYIIAFRSDNFALLEEIYTNHTPQVTRWILNNSGTLADAKDIFQETLISIIKKAYDPDFLLTYPIGGLIFQIAKNKWTDELRKKKIGKKVRKVIDERLNSESNDFSMLLEEIEQDEINQKRLDQSFAKLSDHCKQLLKLISEGVKPKDIVNSMNMNSINTVYRRKNACIQRWKELFNN